MTARRPARKIRDIETFLARQGDLRFWRRFRSQKLMRLSNGPAGDIKWYLAGNGENVRYDDLGGESACEVIR